MKNEDWNESGVPLAYLITFRCYGTWLHGDERGSVDQFNNKFDSPFLPSNEKWLKFVRQKLKHEPVEMNAVMRKTVDSALRETCTLRGWPLLAVNVRTNHVHLVIKIGQTKSRAALSALKANATGKLRECSLWRVKHSPWAEKESRRFLWNEKSIEAAIEYVIDGQEKPLPDFD